MTDNPNGGNPLESPSGEFELSRGEKQRPGTKGIKAIPPSVSHVPVGIAPPSPLVVVSTFDTRPISAFDFCFEDVGILDQGEAANDVILTGTVPDGFTLVLRRIRLEFTPNGLVNLTTATSNEITLQLLRNRAVIPSNLGVLRGSLDVYEWHTHQVFGMGEEFGMQVAGGFLTPASTIYASAMFYGTLIQSKSLPPETEIASLPVVVRSLEEVKLEQQR